jgi:hypothetical protein
MAAHADLFNGRAVMFGFRGCLDGEGTETTKKGPTFTTRKLRNDPISPVKMAMLHTADSRSRVSLDAHRAADICATAAGKPILKVRTYCFNRAGTGVYQFPLEIPLLQEEATGQPDRGG